MKLNLEFCRHGPWYQRTLTQGLGAAQAHLEIQVSTQPIKVAATINDSINTHGPQQLRGALSLIP